MTGVEILEEVVWFQSFNMHPEQIAVQIGRKERTIYDLARKHGFADVQRYFGAKRAEAVRW